MRTCKTCKWRKGWIDDNCTHPVVNGAYVSPVDGHLVDYTGEMWMHCGTARHLKDCGPRGILWNDEDSAKEYLEKLAKEFV